MQTTIVREVAIERTPRVLKLEGLFDIPPSQRSEERWEVHFDLPEAWNVGLIVGPSGSGKSTLAHELFGGRLVSDWVFQPHTGKLERRLLRGRPLLELEIGRVHRQAWRLFQAHHYLTGDLHKAASCFVAFVAGRPAAFCAVLSFPHPTRPGWR